jgi:hypothetical protein
VTDEKQIEEAAANDPTKAGKIEFFMQFVYLNENPPARHTFTHHFQGHALSGCDRVALVQGPVSHHQGQSLHWIPSPEPLEVLTVDRLITMCMFHPGLSNHLQGVLTPAPSGGLPARMANGQGLKLIEPLRSLYKVCPSLAQTPAMWLPSTNCRTG